MLTLTRFATARLLPGSLRVDRAQAEEFDVLLHQGGQGVPPEPFEEAEDHLGVLQLGGLDYSASIVTGCPGN